LKQLKHIINWTIWSLLGLYMLLLLAIHVPAVQRYVGQQVAQAIGGEIGSEVTIGRVDLGFFNRLIIDNVVIKDQQRQNLLTAHRMTVSIDLLPLLDKKVRIASAQLFGARLQLYRETAQAVPNYQFVIDALQSDNPQKESALDLKINSLIVRNTQLIYDQKDAPETPGRFNGKHINISEISAHVLLKSLTADSLHAVVKRLAFKEHSGLAVEHLSLALKADKRKLTVDDFLLEMPRSSVSQKHLELTYDADRMMASLQGRTRLEEVHINPADLAPLWPQLQFFDNVYTLSAQLAVAPAGWEIEALDLASDAGHLALKGRAAYADSTLEVGIGSLTLTGALLAQAKKAFPELPQMTGSVKEVSLEGILRHGGDGAWQTRGRLASNLGNADFQLSADAHQFYEGHIGTEELNLQEIAGVKDLGRLSAQLEVSGTRDTLNAQGHITALQFRQYDYHDITVNGRYHHQVYDGQLLIDDPHLKTEVVGTLKYGQQKEVRLTGYVKDFSPKALNLSDRWGNGVFSAIIDTDFRASSLNDAEGSIDIDDFYLTYEDSVAKNYHLDNLHIKSGYDDGIHYLKMSGDPGEAELAGQFDWATLPQSFINYAASRLPSLLPQTKKSGTAHNNFELNLRLTESEWLQKLLQIPLALGDDLQLNAVVNDESEVVFVNADLPSFYYDDNHYSGGHVELTTEEDTTRIQLNLTKTLKGSQTMDVSVKALAGNNTIRSTVAVNHDDGETQETYLNGEVNTITQLYADEAGQLHTQVRLLPSQLILRGTALNLEPCDILYSNKRLIVDHFNLHNQQQHLVVDGIVSADAADTVTVDLQDIDVAYVLDLVNFRSVRFGGQASGKAFVMGVFGDFNAWTDLLVRDFTFQDGRMGDLTLHGQWNQEEGQIDLRALADAGTQARTHINGYISPTKKMLDLQIGADGTPIDFCESFTKSFFSGVDGCAHGEARLHGALNRLYLTGDLAVEGHVGVKALNTIYELRGDTLRLRPDEIRADGVGIYDRHHGTGQLTGSIRHTSFKHFNFDLAVEVDNLLAYDFPDFDDSSICGTVFATGKADLHGKPGEVVINCDVTSNRNTVFTYNASNPDAISNQQFITWRERYENGEIPILLGDASPDTSVPSDVRINFRINATPDATLKILMDANTGDNISLHGDGIINASYYNKGPFQMFGTYTTERGTYSMTIQNIIRKNFNFQEGGTIIFGGNPFDAALDLKAVYTVNGVSLSDLNIGNSFSNNTVRVNCLMNILGTAGAPRVEFDLEMPTVNAEEQQMIRSIIASEQELNQQVIYLLGIGRFYTQSANNAGTQEYGQTELAMQSFLSGTVSTQINEVLSQVIKNDDWDFGANISTGNEGWHNAEYEGIVNGRMFNNRLLINGQFGYRDNATQATPSFIGDFDIRYLLYPSGNLAVKVYNQTNDRYFTRSSLNTQGIGLIMKKDFDSLRDLLLPRKKKSSSK